jgi:hypothetical protein
MAPLLHHGPAAYAAYSLKRRSEVCFQGKKETRPKQANDANDPGLTSDAILKKLVNEIAVTTRSHRAVRRCYALFKAQTWLRPRKLCKRAQKLLRQN